MALQSKGFCHAKNHNGNGNNPGCRERLIGRWPQLKKAFARLDSGEPVREPPEVKVTIRNTGK